MVDYGDAPVLPADPARSHEAIEQTVGEVVDRRRGPDRARRRPLDRRARHPRMRLGARPDRPRPLRHAHGHRQGGLRPRDLARDADVPARRGGRRGSAPLRPDRAARLLARRGGVRLAGRARDHELLHARRAAARDRRGRPRGDRRRRSGPGLPERRRRRPRSRVRAGNGHARARRDDQPGPALGLPHDRGRARARGRRRRRGDPDRGRLGGHHGARRRPDRPRDPDRDRAYGAKASLAMPTERPCGLCPCGRPSRAVPASARARA